MGVGELGNFAAYGFAPATLIAPLGCVSVIGRCDLYPLIHYPCLVGELKVVLFSGFLLMQPWASEGGVLSLLML